MRHVLLAAMMVLGVGCAHQAPVGETEAVAETETDAPDATQQLETREVRFGLQGPPGVRVDLRLYVDGVERCHMETTIPGDDDPTSDRRVYVNTECRFDLVAPDNIEVTIRAEGLMVDPSGAETPVEDEVLGTFEGVHDALIEVNSEGRIAVILAQG